MLKCEEKNMYSDTTFVIPMFPQALPFHHFSRSECQKMLFWRMYSVDSEWSSKISA